MWRTVLILLIVRRTLTSSAPESKEYVRENRQINFDDCCPCPIVGSDRADAEDLRTMGSHDNCPCRQPSDSQAEPSLLSPVFRTAESFTRPIAKRTEPKPLLQPEVVLASSVLETLHEVTDQEYQEALARDAAKNVLKDAEPRNVVNIILSPKGGYNKDLDTEASHVKETRCIHPQLGGSSRFQPIKLRSPVNIVQHILDSPKLTSNNLLHKKYFDMDGSSSTLHENFLHPFRSNILEDIKTKSNLLKLRLFPNTIDALKSEGFNYYKNVDQNKERANINCADSDSNDAVTLSNNKFTSDIDRLQNPIKHNLAKMPFMRKESREGDDYVSSSNKPNKNYIPYNIRDRTPLDKEKNHNVENTNLHFSNEETVPEEIKARGDEVFIKAFKMDKVSGKSILEKNNYQETEKGNMSKPFEDFNILPRPSELGDVKNLGSEIVSMPITKEECLPQNSNDDIVKSEEFDTPFKNFSEFEYVTEKKIQPHNITEEVSSKELYTNNNDINTSQDEKDTKIIDESNDLESGASFDNVQTTYLDNKDYTTFPEYKDNTRSSNIIESKDHSEDKDPSIFSIDNHSIESKTSDAQTNKIILPNIKDDILKTLENFKKANEMIHNKLRSNVQDALQSISIKPHKESNQPCVSPLSSNGIENRSNEFIHEANVSTQDLQNMSDLLLDLSKHKEENVVSFPVHEQERVEKLESKPEYFDEISSDTNLSNDTRNFITESNLNLENPSMNNDKYDDETKKDVCHSNLLSKSSTVNDLNDEEREMTVQASNSVFSKIPNYGLKLAKGDIIVQPNLDIDKGPVHNIKTFFENIRSSVADIFQNQENSFNTKLNNISEEKMMTAKGDSEIFNEVGRNQEQSVFISSGDGKHDLSSGTTSDSFQFKPVSSLKSYKARIPTPGTFRINPLHPIYPYSNEEADILSSASQVSAIKNLEIPLNGQNLKSFIRNHDKIGRFFRPVQNGDLLQDVLSSRVSVFSDNLRSRTENSLKNIHNYFDSTLMDPIKIKDSHILRNYLTNRDNILKPIRQPFKKLDDLKVGSKGLQLNIQNRKNNDYNIPYTNKYINKNTGKTDIKKTYTDNLKQLRLSSTKNISLPKSKQNIETKTKKHNLISSATPTDIKQFPASNKLKSDRLKLKQKVRISPLQSNLNSKNIKSLTKTPSLHNNIKIKPLKESKVTISFATTLRPTISSKKLKSEIKIDNSNLRSTDTRNKQLIFQRKKLDRKPTFETKSKFSDLKNQASENFLSKVPFTDTTKKSTIIQKSSSEQTLNNFGHFSQHNRENQMPKTKQDSTFVNRKNKSFDSDLLKMNTSGQDLDHIQSSTNNINTSAPVLVKEALKENVSYKCKMVCIKDILNAADVKENFDR